MSPERHPALQNLSQDHQQFLEEANRVRGYLEEDDHAQSLEDLIESLLGFWAKIGEWHLREEEEIIYPAYLAKAPLKQRDVDALYTDHNWLRDKIQDLSAMPRLENTKPLLRSLSEYIVNHVNHEEQTIYPAIQNTLDEAKLNHITQQSRAFREKYRKPEAITEAQDEVTDG